MCIDVMENFKLSVNDDDNDMGGVTIENSTRFVQKKNEGVENEGDTAEQYNDHCFSDYI
jgi:hypothetical protein